MTEDINTETGLDEALRDVRLAKDHDLFVYLDLVSIDPSLNIGTVQRLMTGKTKAPEYPTVAKVKAAFDRYLELRPAKRAMFEALKKHTEDPLRGF